MHLNVSFIFLAYFIPAIVLNEQEDYQADIVSLYVILLTVGAACYVAGLFLGFKIKAVKTNFSFEILPLENYEARVARVTKIFITVGICGMVTGYMMMGFVPMFAADPLAAKFFRNQYQVPFYTSIIYLTSFFILSSIIPIAFMVWYKNKAKVYFLFATITAIVLLAMSLARGSAFTGILYAILIIMSFRSRTSFAVALIFLVFIYSFSSVFYFIIGVRDITDLTAGAKTDHMFWRVLSSGTVDVTDQLSFLQNFESSPIWTYGRTIYGGLIPSHYEWNPAVYTLKVMNPNEDVTTLISGGLRLPAPIWGYVSFQWPGVVIFCFLSGFIKGVIFKYLKTWIFKYRSILTSTVLILICLNVFEQFANFYTLSIYSVPPVFIFIFYLYRVRLRPRVDKEEVAVHGS
ncbi:hypothetical protein [Mucilaginibacter pedocola]|uniref:Oligosaccharide repeat unit polymerase n=1 Tax=Mucilaginibacter pedocola TaxID=1792845 RepID=A0A1S9PET2_9SPHI|nr:hypothetical protein [Mucilaginibacter pedocola]OOQ59465.1 hypothetical protein BC343_04595 [Mucilaginibacter pedocola]